MARQRYINTSFWQDEYIETLDPLERYLYLYYLTNPLTTIAGVYKIGIRRIAFETGIEDHMVKKMTNRFTQDQKIAYIDGYIAIKNFIKHQKTSDKPEDKINIGIKRELDQAPKNVINWLKKGHIRPLEGHSRPLNYDNDNDNVNDNKNDNAQPKEMPKKAPAKAGNVFQLVNSIIKNDSVNNVIKDALLWYLPKQNITDYARATTIAKKLSRAVEQYESGDAYRPLTNLVGLFAINWYENNGGLPDKPWEDIGWIGAYNNMQAKYYGNFQEYYLYNIFNGDTKKVEYISYDIWCQDCIKFSFEGSK